MEPCPKPSMHTLLLASASNARAELLREAGVCLEQQATGAEEPERTSGETLQDYVLRLAQIKRETAARRWPDRFILCADTAIELDGKTLGKPRDRDHAVAMISAMAGREHFLCSACSVHAPGGKTLQAEDTAWIRFLPLSPEQIQDYVDQAQPYRFAGAYAIQGQGAKIVQSVRGRMDTVIGLCVPQALKLLTRIGYGSAPSG